MNITKKILALMVASLMIFSAIPTFAAGESASEIAAAIEIEALTDEEYSRYTFSYRKRNVMQRNIDIIKG